MIRETEQGKIGSYCKNTPNISQFPPEFAPKSLGLKDFKKSESVLDVNSNNCTRSVVWATLVFSAI